MFSQLGEQNNFELLRITLELVVVHEMPGDLCQAILAYLPPEKELLFIRELLSSALQRCHSKETMFREDSGATAYIGTCLKDRMRPLLQHICGPTIRSVCKRKKALELDSSRVGNPDVQKNIDKLKRIVGEFVERFHQYLYLFTDDIREILRIIWKQSNAHTAGQGTQMVASFIFLRFLCAALVAPKNFGLDQYEPTPPQLRSLVLLLKILQNIVNGVPFGPKEGYLLPMNSLVEQYHLVLQVDIQALVLSQPLRDGTLSHVEVLHRSDSRCAMAPPMRELQLSISRFISDYALQSYGRLSCMMTKRSLRRLVPSLHDRSPAVPRLGPHRIPGMESLSSMPKSSSSFNLCGSQGKN